MDAPARPLLELSTRDAVRRIAGRHLAATAKGLSRLANVEDPQRLHAFRVAIRRLRSLVRWYKPWIGRVAGGRVRRGLRELTRDSNAARDAEVQLEWLAGQCASLNRDDRPGCSWLMRKLEGRKRRAYRAIDDRFAAEAAEVARKVRSRFKDREDGEPVAFREVTAGLLETGATKMHARLAAIAGADDVKCVHRSRIQVKRLRYLLEPLRRELPEARDAVRTLGKLQDLLGDLHDRHMLEDKLARDVEEAAREKARRLHALAVAGRRDALSREQKRDERIGLLTLAARARMDRDRLYGRFRKDWSGRSGALLDQQIVRLLRALAPPS
jgi:CHAD domain-containing protein